ncbi:hypothetical protein AAE478_007045 [Parahypoxylon ruwenzoriense]
MGFTTGFTGGVTLTLSIAYLTVLAHQRNRERQAAVLRQQTYLLSGIVDPLPPTLPPTRAETAAADRAHLAERAKDRWNSEVEGAVRWAQTKDWDEVREGVETAVARLWARAFNDEAKNGEKGGEEAGSKLSQSEAVVREKKESVAAAAKSAYADAKAKSSDAKARTEQKAEEKKDSIFGAIGRGFARGKEVVGRVVGITEKKPKKPAEKTEELPSLTPEEKTLNQRYQGPAGLDRSPEEVLAERYAPTKR